MSLDGRRRSFRIPNKGRVTNMPQTRNTRTQQILPQLDSSTPLLNQWKVLTEAISIFLTNNSETLAYHAVLSKALLDSDTYFNVFYKNFLHGIPMRKRVLQGDSSPRMQISQDGEQFFKSYADLKSVILQISQNGTKVIKETVESSFKRITDTFNTIKKSSDDLSSNDPITRRIQTLTIILNPIKKSVLAILRRRESVSGQGRLTTELRNYSRAINSAFRSEFSVLPLSAAEMETLRSTAYNTCSDIIYGLKAFAMFDENIAHINRGISEFDGLIEREFGKSASVSPKSSERSSTTSSNRSTDSFDVNDYDKLSPLLGRMLIYVKEGGNDKDFMQNAILKSYKMAQDLEQKISKLDPNHVNVLERQLFEIREKLNKSENDKTFDELKSCMFETIEDMKMRLRRTDLRLTCEEDIVPVFTELYDNLTKKKDDNEVEKELMNILQLREKASIVGSVKEKLSLINFYKEESAKYNNDLTKKIHERICILCSQMNISLCEDDVSTLDKIADTLSEGQGDNESSTCHAIASIFGLDVPEKATLNNTVFKLKKWHEKNEMLLKTQEELLRDTEKRLQSFLSVQPTNQSIDTSLKSLIDLLETTSNQQSYRKLNAVFNRIQSLNSESGEALVLNAGSDYYLQINNMIDTVSEQFCNLSKAKRKLEAEKENCRNLINMMHQKLAKHLSLAVYENDNSDDTIEDIISETSELVDELRAREEVLVSNDFICDALGADKGEDARSVIMDRASRLNIYEFSVKNLHPFSEILEKALAAEKIGSSNWVMKMRDCSMSLNNLTNQIASLKINSTLFLLISRFVSLISTLVPTNSSSNLPMFCK